MGSYTGGEITDDKSNAEGVTSYPPALVKGKDLPNVSKSTHSVNLRYQSKLFNTGWSFVGTANYSTRSKPGSPTATSETLIPAKAAWKAATLNLHASKGPLGLSLSMKNLTNFDQAYQGGTSESTTGMIPRPRSIELTVSYDGFNR